MLDFMVKCTSVVSTWRQSLCTKVSYSLLIFLALATIRFHAAPIALAIEHDQVASVDNSSPDESQGAIDSNGAKLGAGTGTSGN